MLLPSFLIVLLLALQPSCMLYTRAVMESAAAEAARLLVTTREDDAVVKAFVLRRLAAVPDLEIFHAGGALSWKIDLGRATGGVCWVEIEGWARPLPVIGAFVGLFGERNARGDVRIRVAVELDGRPEWFEGESDAREDRSVIASAW